MKWPEVLFTGTLNMAPKFENVLFYFILLVWSAVLCTDHKRFFVLFANRNALGVIETRTRERNKCLCQVYVTHSELFFVELFLYILNRLCLMYTLTIPTMQTDLNIITTVPFECVPACGFDWRLYKPQTEFSHEPELRCGVTLVLEAFYL